MRIEGKKISFPYRFPENKQGINNAEKKDLKFINSKF